MTWTGIARFPRISFEKKTLFSLLSKSNLKSAYGSDFYQNYSMNGNLEIIDLRFLARKHTFLGTH